MEEVPLRELGPARITRPRDTIYIRAKLAGGPHGVIFLGAFVSFLPLKRLHQICEEMIIVEETVLHQIIKGSCHCGAVHFEITADIYGLRRCNCSICRRKGAIMAICQIEEFSLIAGEQYLSHYHWNSRNAAHYFCSICGIYTHHKRRSDSNSFCYNLGCIEEVDAASDADIRLIDGASMSLIDD